MSQSAAPMTFKDLRFYIRRDLGYVNGNVIRSFISRYFFEPGFRFVVWLRLTRYFYLRKSLLFYPARMILKYYSHKYHFDISYRAQIGPGLQIAHFGYIIVMSNTTIGAGCRLRPGGVFGKKLTQETKGAVVGDNVEFGVGAKIVGAVHIGDNVIIGANSVITHDIPSDVSVAGAPARVLRSFETNP